MLMRECVLHGHITTDVFLRHLLGDDSVWIKTGTLFSCILDIKFPVTYSPHLPDNLSYGRKMTFVVDAP